MWFKRHRVRWLPTVIIVRYRDENNCRNFSVEPRFKLKLDEPRSAFANLSPIAGFFTPLAHFFGGELSDNAESRLIPLISTNKNRKGFIKTAYLLPKERVFGFNTVNRCPRCFR